jgi:pyruvate/2-oxoglutarate dehydrogenase complex dihydrolipoamide dehydrogenase (E3) component
MKPAEEFDTVLFAVGRQATTDTLNLAKIGV